MLEKGKKLLKVHCCPLLLVSIDMYELCLFSSPFSALCSAIVSILYRTVWGVEPVVTRQTSWLDSIAFALTKMSHCIMDQLLFDGMCYTFAPRCVMYSREVSLYFCSIVCASILQQSMLR